MNELGRLKWQCRRGTLELDLILQNYLETRYLLADVEEQARFVELLKLEDAQLLELLMVSDQPFADPGLRPPSLT